MPAPWLLPAGAAAAASSPVKPISTSPSPTTSAAATPGAAAKCVSRRGHGRVVAEDVDAQDRTNSQAGFDLGQAALGEDAPAVDDRERGAQLLELGEDVAADEDRLAQRAQLAEQLAELDPGPRVEARGGLVEDQDGGIVDEGVGQAEALLHAPRQGGDVRVALGPRSTSSSRSPIMRRRRSAGRPWQRPKKSRYSQTFMSS